MVRKIFDFANNKREIIRDGMKSILNDKSGKTAVGR
jgi:hypothetical protein